MSDSKPLFSIATPCWNNADTIERTIRSILSQDFKDYEYLIVDGGSTDGTLDIIKRYEPLFEGRMLVKSEPDNGLYDAFNKGVERSRGIYCWNVNADDYVEQNALANLARYIQNGDWGENLPIISGIMNFVSRDGKEILLQYRSNHKIMAECYRKDHIGLPHPATLVPKAIYEKHGAFDTNYKICGDLDWFHRVYEAGESFVFADIIVSNMADGGISNVFNYKRSLSDRKYYCRKFYPNFFERSIRLVLWTLSFYKQKIEHWVK